MTGTESLPRRILTFTSKASFTLLLTLDMNLQMLLPRCVLATATATANATASLIAGMHAALHHAEDRYIHEFQQGSRPIPHCVT